MVDLRKISESGRVKALGLYAQILGRKFGIRIKFDRNCKTAATDGQSIVLPEGILKGCGAERSVLKVFGLIAHEAMHLRLTNFHALSQRCKDEAARGTNVALLQQLSNSTEDVWGEREFIEYFPGIWKDIVGSMEVMIDEGLYSAPKPREVYPPAVIFSNFWLMAHLSRHYKEIKSLKTTAGKWRMEALNCFGQELVMQIENMVPLVDNVSSTLQNLEYTLKLMELIKSSGSPKAGSVIAVRELDLGDAICSEKGDALKSGPISASPSDVNLEAQAFRLPSLPMSDSMNAAIQAVGNRLSGRLEQLLQAHCDLGREYMGTGIRLSSSRLAGIRAGKVDVFERTDLEEELNTAVAISFDGSGSMRKIWDLALTAGYALADVLRRYEVPIQLGVFSRSASIWHPFSSDWRQVRHTVPEMPSDSTSFSSSMVQSAEALLARSEPRRVHLLISDGEPDDLDFAVTIAKQMREAGLEQVFMFLADDGKEAETAFKQLGFSVSRVSDPTVAAHTAAGIEQALAKGLTRLGLGSPAAAP